MMQKMKGLIPIQNRLTRMLLQSPLKSIIDIAYWKQRNFLLSAKVYLIGGIPLFLVGSYFFYLDGYYLYAAAQALLALMLGVYLLQNNVSEQHRSFAMLLFLLFNSFAVMMFASYFSAGMIILLGTIFLASLLLNEKELKHFLLLNLFISLIFSLLLFFNVFDSYPIVTYKRLWMFHLMITQTLVIGFSLIVLNMHMSINHAYQKMVESIQLSELNQLRFQSSIVTSPVPTIIYNQKGEIVSVNPAWENITGYNANNVKDLKQWLELTLVSSEDSIADFFLQLTTINENHFNGIFSFKTTMLSEISLAIYTSTIGEDDHRNTLFLTVGIDLTEQLKFEKISNSIIESSKDAFFLLDIEGQILSVNETACSMFGYSRDRLVGSNIIKFDSQNQHYIIDQLNLVKEKAYHRFETSHLRRDGRKIDLDVTASIIETNGTYIYLFMRDISEKNAQIQQILHVSTHDSLTNTYNRHYLQSFLNNLNYHASSFSIVFFDINGIKMVNDSIGYEYSDQLLVEFSKMMSSSLRFGDILARTGASEFMIYIHDLTKDITKQIIDEILKKIDEFNSTQTHPLKQLNVSYGYVNNHQTNNVIELQHKAQQHLTSNKLADKHSLRNSLLNSIVTILSEKSHETKEHATRLSELSVAMGKRLNMAEHHISELKILAMLHDIGKIGIPENILNKPSSLTSEEWEVMKQHPEIGYRIAIASGELEQVAQYILYHHERWDGQGYPAGLKEEEIPLPSRIISIVDTYDAMTSDRVYRKKLPHHVAIEELCKHSNSQFDAQLVKIFIEIIEEYQNKEIT